MSRAITVNIETSKVSRRLRLWSKVSFDCGYDQILRKSPSEGNIWSTDGHVILNVMLFLWQKPQFSTIFNEIFDDDLFLLDITICIGYTLWFLNFIICQNCRITTNNQG